MITVVVLFIDCETVVKTVGYNSVNLQSKWGTTHTNTYTRKEALYQHFPIQPKQIKCINVCFIIYGNLRGKQATFYFIYFMQNNKSLKKFCHYKA